MQDQSIFPDKPDVKLLFLFLITTFAARAQHTQVTDAQLRGFELEVRRSNMIDRHHMLVDLYNNLLNKIALVKSVTTKDRRNVNIPEITKKNLDFAQTELSRSTTIGTLKNRQKNPDAMDAIALTFESVLSKLEEAKKVWNRNYAPTDQIEVYQSGECIRKAVESGVPMTADEVSSKVSGPLVDCLNAQKIAINGQVLTYDGLKPIDKAILPVRIKAPMPPVKKTPETKAPLVANGEKPKSADKTAEIDKNAKPGDVKTTIRNVNKGEAVSADKVNQAAFLTDKKKTPAPQALRSSISVQIKITAKNKTRIEDFNKARAEQNKEREKKAAKLMTETLRTNEPLPKPADVPTDAIEKTRLDEKEEQLTANAKLRDPGALAAASIGILNDVKAGKQSSVDYGALLLETEVGDSAFKEKDKVFGMSLEKYLKLKKKYKALASTLGSLSYTDKVLRIAEELNHDLLSEYSKGKARILDFMLGNGGNCDAESRLMLSVLHENGLMSGDANTTFGIQIFKDHVQPVLYDKTEKTVRNLVANYEVKGVVTPIVRPEVFFHAYLTTHSRPTPTSAKSLILVAADQALAQKVKELQKNAGGNSGGGTNTNINLPDLDGGVSFASGDAPIPAHAKITFNKKSGSSTTFTATDQGGPTNDSPQKTDFTGGAFLEDKNRDTSHEISDKPEFTVLLDKAKQDYANALKDPDFQEYAKIIANPLLLKDPKYTFVKIAQMKAAVHKAQEILKLTDKKYFLNEPASNAFTKEDSELGKNARYELFKSQNDYVQKLVARLTHISDYYDADKSLPIYEALGPDAWARFEDAFSFMPMSDMLTLSRNIKPDYMELDRWVAPHSLAKSFLDPEKISFETTHAKTKKLEKIGKLGSKEDSKKPEESVKKDVDPNARPIPAPTPPEPKKDSEKPIAGTQNAIRNQREKLSYGRDDQGNHNKPDLLDPGSKKISAENFAEFIRNYEVNRGRIDYDSNIDKDLTPILQGLLARWTPLLSEELRLNEKEESLELMKWFVDKGFRMIRDARITESMPQTPMTNDPESPNSVKDLGGTMLPQDLARLYAHYYQKLKDLGVETQTKPNPKQLKAIEKLTQDYDE